MRVGKKRVVHMRTKPAQGGECVIKTVLYLIPIFVAKQGFL